MSPFKHARVALVLVAALSAPRAFAQEPGKGQGAVSCDEFSWSVAREREWFSDARLPRRESGARLKKIDRAVLLELRPTPSVNFFLPPERKPKADSFSGEVTFFGVPKPGLYQVTLSDEASIDVFENGARLKAVGVAIGKNCPGIGKSVRFELAPGDLVLVEVSDAPTRSIKVAFAEAR